MFLWLTSPAANKIDGDAGIVLNSPAFFRVSRPDRSQKRKFIPNANSRNRVVAVRAAKRGPHGLPVIIDKSGSLFEVEPTKLAPDKKPLVRSRDREVEVEKITLAKHGKLPFQFLDTTNEPIPDPKPIIHSALRGSAVVQRFTVGKVTVFLNSSGDEVGVEEGQAGTDGVLLTQRSELVHYMISVNDVFAYFLTGTKGGGITPKPTQFPTTPDELAKITAFVAAHRHALHHPIRYACKSRHPGSMRTACRKKNATAT
jgi:hypothetical protein